MKKLIVAVLLIAISTSASANTKDSILKACQDLIKKDTKVHPRLVNIKKHGKYKYTFDVVFIQRGKEVDWLKDSFYDKNYSCEYYPEEEMIYKRFSEKQIAEDKAKREAAAKKKAKEKAIRDAKIAEERALSEAKEAQLEAERKAMRDKIKAKADKNAAIEANRIKKIKMKGSFYARSCFSKMRTRGGGTLTGYIFKDNYNTIVIKMSVNNKEYYKGKCSIIGKTSSERLLAYQDLLDRGAKWIKVKAIDPADL